jgi:hypothetical protein
MRSSFASLLYIAGVTVYAAYSNYWTYPYSESYDFWLLFLAILPYYFFLFQKNSLSHAVLLHHWFIATSLSACLGTVASDNEGLIVVAYMNLFGVFILTGHLINQKNPSLKSNGYISVGYTLTLLLLLASTFHDFWQDIIRKHENSTGYFGPELIAVSITGLLAFGLIALKKIKFREDKIRPLEIIFILFAIIYLFSFVFPTVVVFTNILFLLLCIQIIREGIKKEHLGITNLGLLMITALVACRFFDTDLEFAVRGALFLFVGIGFFVTNFLLIKKRNG